MLLITLLNLVLSGTIFGYTVDSKPYYDMEKARDYFEDFLINYNKTYANEEERKRRFETFKHVLMEINKLNLESEHTVFGITKFSDLTPDELRKFYPGFRMPKISLRKDDSCVQLFDKDVNTNTAPEDRFDWRDRNVVTEAKQQGQCGACWAFAATGVVEAQYALKHKQLETLSVQQCVDCIQIDHDSCSGALPEEALDLLIKEGGQMSNADYPYVATLNSCKFDSSKIIAKVAGCSKYALKDETKLKEVLYTKGPLAVGMDFSISLYNGYHGGVIDHTQCGKELSHAVLLVGYGITDKGVKYWTMKNSFGSDWGENGFFRLEMGTNACGIMIYPSVSATVF